MKHLLQEKQAVKLVGKERKLFSKYLINVLLNFADLSIGKQPSASVISQCKKFLCLFEEHSEK